MKKFFAFTLAEVLLTLGIIGVVAVLTIAPLILNTEKQEYIVALKKQYTVMNQLLRQMATDYGCTNDLACTGLFHDDSETSIGPALEKYLKMAKVCGLNTGEGCFPEINQNYNGTGSTFNFDSYDSYKFITMDGTAVYLYNMHSDCGTDNGNGLGYMSKACAWMLIDVNGFKSPNRLGRDVFGFWIVNGKSGPALYPQGGPDDAYGSGYWDGSTPACTGVGSSADYSCAGRIIEQSWQMKY